MFPFILISQFPVPLFRPLLLNCNYRGTLISSPVDGPLIHHHSDFFLNTKNPGLSAGLKNI